MAKEANKPMTNPLNRSLHAAKSAKQDEFYIQYVDIQKEVEACLEFDPDSFRHNIVYCNCDDPFESNFFKYFTANFNKLGVKKLSTTSYDHVKDENNDRAADIGDVKLFLKRNKAARIALKADEKYPGGDFRSQCVEFTNTH